MLQSQEAAPDRKRETELLKLSCIARRRVRVRDCWVPSELCETRPWTRLKHQIKRSRLWSPDLDDMSDSSIDPHSVKIIKCSRKQFETKSPRFYASRNKQSKNILSILCYSWRSGTNTTYCSAIYVQKLIKRENNTLFTLNMNNSSRKVELGAINDETEIRVYDRCLDRIADMEAMTRSNVP